MFIELTLADGNRPWQFRWMAIEAIGRNQDDTATMVAMPSGTYSVVERPDIIAEIARRRAADR
jgi:hypothetical protein